MVRFIDGCISFLNSNLFKNIVCCLVWVCVLSVCVYAQGTNTEAGDGTKVKGTVENIKKFLVDDIVPVLSIILLFVAGGFLAFDRQNGVRKGLLTIGGVVGLNLLSSIYGLIVSWTGGSGGTQ